MDVDIRSSQLCLLETLTKDAWAVIVSFLDSTELLFLWEACNSRLLRRVCENVTEFVQLSYKAIPFPALRSFKLRKLSLITFQLFINPFDLLMLPKTLEELSLSFPSSQNCWLLPPKASSFVDEALAEPIILRELFPSLHTLRLTGRVWSRYELLSGPSVVTALEWTAARKEKWMKGLPPSLTILHLVDALLSPTYGIEHLTNLRELTITSKTRDIGWKCPNSLEVLNLHAVPNNFTFEPSPSLTRLSISVDGLADIASALPPTLIEFNFDGHFKYGARDLSLLPKTLESLRLTCAFAEDLAYHLPRSLKHLTVESRRNWSWFPLPPALETLVCGTSNIPAVSTAYTDEDFGDLPATLKTLHIAIPLKVSDPTAEALPPSLTHLTLKSSKIKKEWLLSLSSNITYLSVSSIEIDAHAELLADYHSRVNEEIDEDPNPLTPAALERRSKLKLPQALISDFVSSKSHMELHKDSWVMTGLKDSSALLVAPTVEHVILFHPPPITWSFVTNLCSVTRHLVTLELWVMHGSFTLPASLAALPMTLTKFTLTDCALADENNPAWAASLPRDLIELQLGAKFRLSPMIAAALPPSLTTLNLRSAFGDDMMSIKQLPRTLKNVHLPDFGRTGRRNLMAEFLPSQASLS